MYLFSLPFSWHKKLVYIIIMITYKCLFLVVNRCVSTERQFLIDFIAGAESSAGGRLARWLAPTPQVEPSKCEIKGPPLLAHPNTQLSLPILIRDQYGESVTCSSLKIEVRTIQGDSAVQV